MNKEQDIIQVHELKKFYKKNISQKKQINKNNISPNVEVFNNLSFTIKKSTRTIISGESGSGKTTLLSILSGLDSCDGGSVVLFDKNNNAFNMKQANEKMRAKFRLQNLGFVFQYHYLLQDFTALDNVTLPLLMIGKHKKLEIKQLAQELLIRVGLKDRMHHKAFQLSGGECQRVAIARALIHKPVLLLADEPTGALDAKNSAIIRVLLHELVSEFGTSIVVASHDTDFLSIANNHWHLENKNLQAQKIINST